MIQYSRQVIDKKDIDSVVKVLKKDLVTTGPKIEEFENKINKFLGAKYGAAVNSATSALHISCIALGLKKGDWLWTSPISFVASANCGLYCGAKIDFIDIDKKTFNISITELKKKLILAKAKKKLPKIIVPVSFAGQCCDLKEIKKLSKIYKFKILEDSSHALGAKYEGQKVGNGKYTDISVFSFHPVKIITTLEGGIAITNNKKLNEKLKMLREHGITRKKNLFKNIDTNDWYYEQQLLGFNYRMNDIEAALGIEQLKKINKFFKKRIFIKKFYDQNLKKLPIKLPHIDKNKISSMHLYVITLNDKFTKKHRDNFIKILRKKGIGVNVHYIPIHLQPYFKGLGFKKGMFPESEKFYEKAISLPIHPKITEKELLKIRHTIKSLFINE